MPAFTFAAIESGSGRERRGRLEAESVELAILQLKARGLYPMALDAEATAASGAKAGLLSRRIFGPVSRQGITILTRQLATLLKARLPTVRALEAIARQQRRGAMRDMVQNLAVTIREGGALSDALGAFPRQFDGLYVSMVRAGEASGAVDLVLERLAAFREKSDRVRGRVRNALMYPLVVLSVAVAVVAGLMIFVIPRFQAIYAGMLQGQALPWLTERVIAVAGGARTHGPLLVLGLAAAVVALRQVWLTRRGGLLLDSLVLRAPVVGELVRKTATARVARTLGVLLGADVPVLPALQISSQTAGNRRVAQALAHVRESVAAGGGISASLGHQNVFPHLVTSMVEVGEESGALAEMLIRVAETYEEEADRAMDLMTSLLEPLMIVLMAAMVGTVVIALFLPIVRIIQTLS